MVRCFDCLNRVQTYVQNTEPGLLFDQTWKCKVTGQVFDMYYLIEKERECLHCKRRMR